MMHITRKITLLLSSVLMLSGCSANTAQPESTVNTEHTTAVPAETVQQTETATAETTAAIPGPEPYRFNPHVYSEKLAAEIPQENWDAFYHLCDALRAGETTFACGSQAAYEWATDPAVLGHLFPAACMKISAESNDGTAPYENGTGRIYYNIPAEEYTVRQAAFEETITDILNSWLEPDDDDFEKCLKLYDYMESNYSYEEFPEESGEGAHYYTIMHQNGTCTQLGGVYAYLLMQVGVDAMEVGCFEPDMCHAWTYVVLDGQGYHIDPTWALKSDRHTDRLWLEYFMMTDEHRIQDGCLVDNLTVDLLPVFFVNRSSLTFTATDDRYYMKDYAELDSLDEEHKTVHYTDMYGESYELYYGR